mmetsp:Transcript_25048/g.42658  ORF Transcript_25048/g.42658 Transcript_25048/m.42658 type:complete len:131 (-) Transcript_25048:232-624(-)
MACSCVRSTRCSPSNGLLLCSLLYNITDEANGGFFHFFFPSKRAFLMPLLLKLVSYLHFLTMRRMQERHIFSAHFCSAVHKCPNPHQTSQQKWKSIYCSFGLSLSSSPQHNDTHSGGSSSGSQHNQGSSS